MKSKLCWDERVGDVLCESDCLDLNDFINDLIKLRDTFPPEIQDLLQIQLNAYGDYCSATVDVFYQKLETDAEYAARLQAEAEEERGREAQREREERALYKRLKKKFAQE